MKLRMAFSEAYDARFVVLIDWIDRFELGRGVAEGLADRFAVVTYDDEDAFLKLLVKVELSGADETRVVRDVLLSMTQAAVPQRWTELTLSDVQVAQLTLQLPEKEAASSVPDSFEFGDDASYFHHFLMQSPTPFVILRGREHRFRFINPPYIRLIGRSPEEEFLGRTIREVLPELNGQPFFGLLDEVYRSGAPFVGKQVPGRLRGSDGTVTDRYFDFIYHPLHNRLGEVCGIMVQAADVTEDVLAREVSDQRERMLYRQWAELATIYRMAPVGMALIQPHDRRVLRLNERLAEFLGATVSTALGRTLGMLAGGTAALIALVDRAIAGESLQNQTLSRTGAGVAGQVRTWLVSLSPALGASGEVEAVSCVTVEVSAPEVEASAGIPGTGPRP